jgi:hypothetical protein
MLKLDKLMTWASWSDKPFMRGQTEKLSFLNIFMKILSTAVLELL